jgi:LEA14-like dessication related protein
MQKKKNPNMWAGEGVKPFTIIPCHNKKFEDQIFLIALKNDFRIVFLKLLNSNHLPIPVRTIHLKTYIF